METFVVKGGTPLSGTVVVSGAKNVALKLLIASLLTDDALVIQNVPQLRDVMSLIEVLSHLGVVAVWEGHTLRIQHTPLTGDPIVPLDVGARLRTSSMVLGPLLARYGKGTVPNPGGCRLGARPIDRHIEGLRQMGARIDYNSDDGYFYAKAENGLHGATITFSKNTHTGTESIILAAVLATGQTIIENAAEEIEVDDLIVCLNAMGAKIKRNARTIVIDGVQKLHGVTYSIMPDRNEEVTFAIAAALTGGDIVVKNSQVHYLTAFLEAYKKAGGQYEVVDPTSTRYFMKGPIKPVDVVTEIHPGFMTDWQAPWAVLMTQAIGVSTIHETVFESRFSYVSELAKMGAKIEFYDPVVATPETFYNFNKEDKQEGYHQGIKIVGPSKLHNAVLVADDIRAGASLVLAALVSGGESYIRGVEKIDRGYEHIESRLSSLGAHIKRIKEEI